MLKKRDSSIWFMKSEIRNSAHGDTYRITRIFRDKQEKERQVHFKYEPAFPLYLRDE